MKFPIFLISIFFASSALSQGIVSNACSFAPIICDGDQYLISVGASPGPTIPDSSLVSNPFTNPNSNPGNSGCLLNGEINPNWFVIDVETPGLLAFHFSVPGGSGFFDWIMWTYDSTTCQMIAADSLVPVACNWNGTSIGITGLADSTNLPAAGNVVNFEAPLNVVAGDQFIICVSSGSSQVGNLLFTNTGTAGLCQSTADIEGETLTQEKELIKIVDLTGREVEYQPNTLFIYMYSDGSSERVFKME